MAGIIDGEGTISMSLSTQVSSAGREVVQISRNMRVTNTDIRLLEWLRDTTGLGKVSQLWQNPNTIYDRFRKGNIKPLYAWSVYGMGMRILLRQLVRYLLVKKPQAILLMESLSLVRKRGNGRAYSERVLVRQWEIGSEIKRLNKRGV